MKFVFQVAYIVNTPDKKLCGDCPMVDYEQEWCCLTKQGLDFQLGEPGGYVRTAECRRRYTSGAFVYPEMENITCPKN